MRHGIKDDSSKDYIDFKDVIPDDDVSAECDSEQYETPEDLVPTVHAPAPQMPAHNQ